MRMIKGEDEGEGEGYYCSEKTGACKTRQVTNLEAVSGQSLELLQL